MHARANRPYDNAGSFHGGAKGSMGTVVTFPEARSVARDAVEPPAGSATVIILPVVRIERYDDGPSGDVEPSSSSRNGKRRRRASRS
jgi:hypothetical protein